MKDPHAATWRNKVVLITGVCGTIGQEILRQIVDYGAPEIIGIDNNESDLFLLGERYRKRDEVQLFVGDVRDRDRLGEIMRGVDIVLHAAALKHVYMCERSPRDAVLTNVMGTQNVIDAALTVGPERVIFTSSDKAVSPTGVLGTSKLMGERLMTAANGRKRNGGPIFASTRFGNVIGSRGSVVPLFKQQIAAGGPVTLTDPAMTRFIMSLSEAVSLVLRSCFEAKGGELFVTKMPTARISDMASVMIEELAPRHGYEPDQVPIEVVGPRPGEKLYEELLNDEEARRALDAEQFFVILPALSSNGRASKPCTGTKSGLVKAYNSSVETPMTQEAMRKYLWVNGIFEATS